MYQGVPMNCGVLQSKFRLKKSSKPVYIVPKLSIYKSIYKSNTFFPTILYKTESWHQKYALKLWQYFSSGSSLLVKDRDKPNGKVQITILVHVASSESRDEVFYNLHFRKSILHTCSILQ